MACNARSCFLIILVCTIFFSSTEVYGQEYDDSYKEGTLMRKADSLRQAQSWNPAIETYKIAEEKAKNEQDWAGYIYSINQAGYCLRRNRKYPEARALFDRALREAPELLGDYHPEIARTYYHLGYYYWTISSPSHKDSSLWARSKSVEINERSTPSSQEDLASSYYALASLLTEGYDNHFEAINLYEKALTIRKDVLQSNDPDLGKTYEFLGNTFYELDDHSRAHIYIKTAINIFNSNPNSSIYDKYSSYNFLGISQLKTNENEEAIKNIKKSSQIIAKRYGPNDLDQIRRYNNLAIAYSNIDKIDSARKYVNWALKINLGNPDFVDTRDLADSYGHLGSIFRREGNYDSAVFYYQRSNSVLPEGDFRISDNYSLISEIYFDQGQYDKSISASTAAISSLEPDAEDLALTLKDPKQPIAVFQPLHMLARSQVGIYNQTRSPKYIADAMNSYYQLEQLKDLIRNAPFSNEAKYEISDQFIASSSEFLDLLASGPPGFADQEIKEIAFEVMERNRYSELFRNVVNVENSSHLDVPDSLLRLEKLLAAQISNFIREDPNRDDSTKTARLLSYERDYQAVKQALSERFPSYYESKFGKELKGLPVIQSNLKPGEQVLEYFWGDSLITILSITPDASDLHFVPITGLLEQQILKFHRICSKIPPALAMDEKIYKDYESEALPLFEILVKPFLNSGTQQLIIIPDGPISLIPYEALLSSSSGTRFKNAPFLVREVNMRYGYSCNLMFQDQEKRVDKRPGLLAMAYSEGYSSLEDLDRKGETNIPGSGLELASIRRIFKQKRNQFLFGNEATETAFKARAQDFGIIHLAVHGIGDTTNAFNSHLIFPSMTEEDDGQLYAYELYALDFQKLNLVVLSACETGIGKEYPGEGIFSMARGFRYSGASSTVMSLWDVADNTTAEIMAHFYEGLGSGTPVGEALRQAKLEFMESQDSGFSHPAYWAAFVTIGEDVELTRTPNLLKFLGLFGVLIIVMIMISFRKKSLLKINHDHSN